MREITYTEAMNEALREEMRADPSVYVIGLGLAPNPSGAEAGLLDEFGPLRIRAAPNCETAIAGSAVGAALAGMRPVVELHLADFAFCALDEILGKAGKWRYTHGANGGMTLPITFLVTIGGYVSGASEHSQSPTALYMHAPGLHVVVPTTPNDAKHLLRAAIRDDNPVIFMPHKKLTGTAGPVSDAPDGAPGLGVAEVRRPGSDVTVVAASYMLSLALEAATELKDSGIDVEVIDPRTLVPLDIDTIVRSVRKTGRLVVVDEDTARCGVGAEIGAQVMEHCFDALRAPVARVANPNLPVPYSPPLERAVLPSTDAIRSAILRTVSYA
jgi:pyruvate dehydrogenase E1 component beta subunit